MAPLAAAPPPPSEVRIIARANGMGWYCIPCSAIVISLCLLSLYSSHGTYVHGVEEASLPFHALRHVHIPSGRCHCMPWL